MPTLVLHVDLHADWGSMSCLRKSLSEGISTSFGSLGSGRLLRRDDDLSASSLTWPPSKRLLQALEEATESDQQGNGAYVELLVEEAGFLGDLGLGGVEELASVGDPSVEIESDDVSLADFLPVDIKLTMNKSSELTPLQYMIVLISFGIHRV